MYARFQKVIETCFLLLFLVTPLIMFHKTSELFEFNKMLFVYLLATFIGACWVGKMIITKKRIFKRSPLDIPIVIFVMTQIASTIVSIDQHTSFFGYYSRFNGGLLSIICYVTLYYAFISNCIYSTRKDTFDFVKKMLTFLLISSTLVVLWGIPGSLGHDLTCFIFTGSLNNSCWTDQFHPDERMFSTLGQPNWLGSFLAMTFFIGFYFLWQKRNDKKKYVLYSSFLFITYVGILATRSRSAFFALLIGLCILAVFYYKKFARNRKRATLLIFCILIVPTILFKTGIAKIDTWIPSVSIVAPTQKNTIQSAQSKKTIPALSNVTDSFEIRKIVWKGAVKLGLTYPLFGTGVETFAYSYNFVKPIEHNMTSEWDFIYNKAHNEYLNYLATTGFVGLSAYVMLLAMIMYVCAYKVRNKDNYQFMPFFIAAYSSLLITNFFGFSTIVTNLLLYMTPALCIVLYYQEDDNQELPTQYASRKQFAILSVVVLSLLGITFVCRYFFADINYAVGDSYLKSEEYNKAATYLKSALSFKYEHVYEDKLSSALANEMFFDAYQKVVKSNEKDPKKIDELQKQINALFIEADSYNTKSLRGSPKNALYWKTRAKNYYIVYQLTEADVDFKKAIDALETAQKFAPHDPKIPYSEVLFYLSQFNTIKNKKNDMIRFNENKLLSTINQAIYLKPNYRDAYFAKGLVLKQLGRNEEAKTVFEYILIKINPLDDGVKAELAK